ncbi:MAG TPA: hypothetical protein VGM81_21265 [Burkholderiaceae bacterium]
MDTTATRPESKVILLGLNELNFDFVEQYGRRGALPNFTRLLRDLTLTRTVSEKAYPYLEPWIQWVTVQTGLSYEDHQVFRLGDIVNHAHPQLWELVARKYGASVAAISPMNASNQLADIKGAVFVPDPWTQTPVTAPADVRLLYEGVQQAVNDNADSKITLASAAKIMLGLLRNLRPASIRTCARLAAGARQGKWRKALVLDRIMADVFIRQTARGGFEFSTLFLNAGAHIQHHYMFASQCYSGPLRNPDWYCPPGADPIREVYQLYDEIVGDVMRRFPDYRVLICTGLSQRPNPKLIFYYRPRNHESLLRQLGLRFTSVAPRMSRDFLVTFDTAADAVAGEQLLHSFKALNGDDVFLVDNRGTDLFCMLMYTNEIEPGFRITNGEVTVHDFASCVSLVSIENGIHQTTGYLIDTGMRNDAQCAEAAEIPLTAVFQRVMNAFEAA